TRTCWSCAANTRPARCRSIRCVGADPVLVRRSQGRKEADQRQVRDGGRSATFRDTYRLRRRIVPVDGFFEWKAIKGQKAKQPYAIAMKDGAPFAIAGIWENWKEPASGEWIRTFAIITTDANELVAEIHDRMPVILAREDYARWLGEEPDPRDLKRPLMRRRCLLARAASAARYAAESGDGRLSLQWK